ncbi:MAG TPA: HD domain-containing phosphohydrolase, partial [Polyangiaceae bacterium]|nr:HD domain-containing phosphohydrolase [Polyangiaceae bacterium]
LIPEIVSGEPYVGAIVLTGSAKRADMLDALRLGASGYLRKPIDPVALEALVAHALDAARRNREQPWDRLRVDAELERSHTALAEMAERFAEHLTSAWDLRHVETGAHVRRIARFTEILARSMGESELRSRNLGYAAMLHDVGKIAIPDTILTKQGPLEPAEFEMMKTHPVLGARLLEGIAHPLVEMAARVALSHHERWNGSGYPRGLVGANCPWEARVVAIVDVYDALSQARCYKPAWDEARIVEHFRAASGTLYETELVRVLLDRLPELRAAALAFPDSARWRLAHSRASTQADSEAADAPGPAGDVGPLPAGSAAPRSC